MMPHPPVHTRKIALIRELGYSENEVPEGSFDEDGFDILGYFPDKGPTQFASNEFPRTRIYWPEQMRQRAIDAINGDFAEEIGPQGVAEIAELKRRTTGL